MTDQDLTDAPYAPEQTITGPVRAPVRVLHMVGTLDRGGAETVCLDLCRAIPSTGFAQTFAALSAQEGTLTAAFREAGAETISCPLYPVVSFGPRLWRLLRELRPQVVVAHVSLISAVILLVARLAGVPVRVARLWSEGDGRPDTRLRRFRRAVLRRLLRHTATDVLGVSGSALAFAAPPTSDPRYRVLYNSVDLHRIGDTDRDTARRRWKLPDDAVVFAHLGRAAPEKNRPFLLDVHAAAQITTPGTMLLVAGPGGLTDLVRHRPGVTADPAVRLVGEVDSIGAVLRAADVLLLPSFREGLPGVVLEALAVGLPVLATDLPCLREVAGLVEGLTLLPLDAGAQRWAVTAAALARTDTARREQIALALRASPFLLDRAAQEWQRLWQADTR